MAISIGIGNYIGNRRNIGDGLPKPIARYSAFGKSNTDADRNILKDLSGNGHDITLNNFAYNSMSGYNGYYQDFNTWKLDLFGVTAVRTDSKIVITKTTSNINNQFRLETTGEIKLRVRVDKPARLNYVYFPITGNTIYKEVRSDADNIIDFSDEALDLSIYTSRSIYFNPSTVTETSLIIEQLPLYEGALVSDGINDFGSCPTFPALTDYTVISKRVYLNPPVYDGTFITQGGVIANKSFVFERNYRIQNLDTVNTYSFGYEKYGVTAPPLITWQTKQKYNGLDTLVGSNISNGGLSLFSIYYDLPRQLSAVALYELHIFDRSLSETEIERYINRNIDKYSYIQPKIHYDFSRQTNDSANKTTIYDLSGNANNGTLNNFAFAGMSGFGGFVGGNWKSTGGLYPNSGSIVFSNSKLTASLTGLGSTGVQYTPTNFLPTGVSVTVKITGLKAGFSVIIRSLTNVKYSFTTDGTYIVKIDDSDTRGFWLEGNGAINNVTFEQLPIYPDALVFDGVDDYLRSVKTANIKTVILDWIPLGSDSFAYDGRASFGNGFALHTSYGDTAYSYRNGEGKTYINGTLNTSVTGGALLNKRNVACLTSPTENTGLTRLGISLDTTFPQKMAIYKFLAFEEELTEEQINHMMKRYNIYRK